MAVPDFYADALCAQTDPAIFFPDRGGSNQDAKKVCASCPVRTECLTYALADPTLTGVWGGTTTQQRGRIRAARANKEPAA